MAPLLCGHLIGAGYSQVPPGPEPDVVGQGPPRTVHEIRNALDAGQLHAVPGLLLVLIGLLLRGSVAGEKPLDHKLQEAVLRRELGAASKGNLTYLVHSVAVLPDHTGEAHVDVVLPQPFQQAHKAGVNLQDIRADRALLCLKLKGRLPDRVGKSAV